MRLPKPFLYTVFSVPQTLKNGTSPDTTGLTSEDEGMIIDGMVNEIVRESRNVGRSN